MMSDHRDPSLGGERRRISPWRLCPLAVIVLVSAIVLALGWHRLLSIESVARHHAVLHDFIARDLVTALVAYVALYVVVVALSVPGALFLTVAGGILFGAVIGSLAALVGATIGAICIFLIAKSALGEHLLRRAGPKAERLAEGFRADAFSYLLFLRLVPIFPFWLVNLVPAVCGVSLATFAAATALGVIPATVAFAILGAGLESVVVGQEAAYRACVAAGQADCRLEFHLKTVMTPEIMAALAALGVLALIPVVVKRLRARVARPSA